MTRHLPDSWEGLPALATVLDPGRLTELFGHELGGPLRTSHLRYKPGVSVVARVDTGTTGAVHWVAAYAPAGDGRDKLEKVLARAGRAARHGRPAPVLVADVPGRTGHRLAVGTIGTDPELRRALAVLGPDRARRLGQPGDPARLLRYNPRRRAVLTGADDDGAGRVTKLTAGPAPADPVLLTRLAAAGLPVLAPVPVPGLPVSPHVLHYPWFGDGDLAARAGAPDGRGPGSGPGEPVLEAAAAAGTALAQLHERGPALLGPARVRAPLDAGRKLRSLAADLSALDRRSGVRCARTGRAVAEALAERTVAPERLLHGDFSADQVLVRGDGGPGTPELRLADLDRIRTGTAADDLGSFLAVELLGPGAGQAPAAPEELPLTGALLRGYGTGAALPPWPEILAWAAFHVLARSMEPFRSAAADWRERTDRRVALAQRLVEQAQRAPVTATPAPGPVPSAPGAPPSAPGGPVPTGPVPTGPVPADPVPADPVPADPVRVGADPVHVVDTDSGHVPRTGPVRVRVPETVPDADGRPLRVRRAWPADGTRLVLELEDGHGRIRAGEAAPGAGRPWAVRVLPHGEDPRLPGLAAAAAAGGRVVVHRHRRRAVVGTPDRFVKFLARGRAARVAELSDRLHGLGTAAGFAVPAVLARAEDRVEFSVLPGRSLHELGAAGQNDAYRAAWAEWARCWPALATAAPGTEPLPAHTAEDEARTLARWAGHLEAFPGLLEAPPGAVAARARRIGAELSALPADRRGRVVLHRDLHDQQLLFDGARLGLLDFDTAALGEPELDLANLSVHLELRTAQGLLDPALRAAGQETVTAVGRVLGADPGRLAVHAEATRLRLACVYAFRPRWRGVAQDLLDGLRS
ncbi:phosphotransferase [Kocuria rosea]|uniref:phosphotransferase n=1 Tax=Kocuria rosea TaxID=1275 RepID=UPI001408D9D9|nr:phosphotransferase [Kocuria rosea]